jgi:hypothetical protein
MNVRQLIFLAIFPLVGGSSLAADVTLVPADMTGKWVNGVKQDCGSSAAKYVTFRDNGTLETGRGTAPRSVGFWSTKDNDITLHLLVAPSTSDASNVFYRGRYTYSYETAEVLEASEGVIEIITGTTGNIERSTFTRCD